MRLSNCSRFDEKTKEMDGQSLSTPSFLSTTSYDAPPQFADGGDDPRRESFTL